MRRYSLNRGAAIFIVGVLVAATGLGFLLGHPLVSFLCAAGFVALVLVGEATSSLGRAEDEQFTRVHGRDRGR